MPLINVFLISSTYLIIYTAAMRYFAVASPFRGRSNGFLRYSGQVSVFTVFLVTLMTLPQFFLHKIVMETADTNQSIDTEMFFTVAARFDDDSTEAISVYITRVVPVLSSFLPCLLLVIFNVGLICQLRRATNVRRNACLERQPTHRSGHEECNRRLTVTLIVMISAHIILVLPSDVIKYFDIYEMTGSVGDIVACVLNLSQACNFALNFLLYISMNSTFRETLQLKSCPKCARSRKSHYSSTSWKATETEFLQHYVRSSSSSSPTKRSNDVKAGNQSVPADSHALAIDAALCIE